MNNKFLFFISVAVLISFPGCHKPYDIAADITPPGEVQNVAVQKEEVDLKLSWTPPPDPDLISFKISLYNSDNQRLVTSVDVPADSSSYVFEKLSSGNYYSIIRTRDKENNLSDGVKNLFVFLSEAPTNVKGVGAGVYWNVIRVQWDSLTAKDYTTEIEGQRVTVAVDSIIVEVDSAFKRFALPATATGLVIPDLPDGLHYINVYTHGSSGHYSGVYKQTFPRINFGEKFVRVVGNGHDFYIARYEVTTNEYKKFIVNDLGLTAGSGLYYVDNSKVEPDAWYKWWYGTDPGYYGRLYLLGFNTWEFSLDPNTGWQSNRYAPDASFGRVTWEGAMLYSLVNYNGRCPTREEWLYAAKGGPLSKGYDYAGSNDADEVGWWGWDSGTTFLKKPGQKKPNELGIYDMSGNAAEIIYNLGNGGSGTNGKTIVMGGSFGPIHFWGNEGEDFGIDNKTKPKLVQPEIEKNTGINQNDGAWRMGIRVLIPHEEIIKPPFNRHKYEP